MTTADAKTLKPGDRITWHYSVTFIDQAGEAATESGTVTSRNGSAVEIRWDDGSTVTQATFADDYWARVTKVSA